MAPGPVVRAFVPISVLGRAHPAFVVKSVSAPAVGRFPRPRGSRKWCGVGATSASLQVPTPQHGSQPLLHVGGHRGVETRALACPPHTYTWQTGETQEGPSLRSPAWALGIRCHRFPRFSAPVAREPSGRPRGDPERRTFQGGAGHVPHQPRP
ncbi:hypothetical protein I79_001669 [Cricetulus griseus]|uniref:Uncharacterized protein n=1 Tax=Cricetulus griseus TaxID=10029 RepID=G3GVD3_CRIGR|nr:hypothetical protein I79_001669 [Cricetulus griseus]